MAREVVSTDFLEGVVNETVAGGIEVVLPDGSVLNDTTAAAAATVSVSLVMAPYIPAGG